MLMSLFLVDPDHSGLEEWQEKEGRVEIRGTKNREEDKEEERQEEGKKGRNAREYRLGERRERKEKSSWKE